MAADAVPVEPQGADDALDTPPSLEADVAGDTGGAGKGERGGGGGEGRGSLDAESVEDLAAYNATLHLWTKGRGKERGGRKSGEKSYVN